MIYKDSGFSHSLGKGEVASSILAGSTIFPFRFKNVRVKYFLSPSKERDLGGIERCVPAVCIHSGTSCPLRQITALDKSKSMDISEA